MTQWQDMKSAPKDGTPILVAKHDPTFGWVRGWATWADVRGISGWLSYGFYHPVPGELGLGNPTHWMPLPEPPKEGE